MSRASVLFDAYTAFLLLLRLRLLPPSFCSQTPLNFSTTNEDNSNCTLSCGKISIKPPFRLQGDPPNCGTKAYELSCEENNTIAVLSLYSGKYYVKEINYNHFTIRIVDTGVHKIRDNYFSNPRYSLTSFNFTDTDPYDISYAAVSSYVPIIYVNCTNPMDSPLFVETAPCINKNTYSNSSNSSLSSLTNVYSYFMVGSDGSSDLGKSCKITQMVMVSPSTYKYKMSCEDIYNEIACGVQLSWYDYGCKSVCGKDYGDSFCTLNDVYQFVCNRPYPPSGGVRTWDEKIVSVLAFKLALLAILLYAVSMLLWRLRIYIMPNMLFLEGGIEGIQMPPKPFLYPQQMPEFTEISLTEDAN